MLLRQTVRAGFSVLEFCEAMTKAWLDTSIGVIARVERAESITSKNICFSVSFAKVRTSSDRKRLLESGLRLGEMNFGTVVPESFQSRYHVASGSFFRFLLLEHSFPSFSQNTIMCSIFCLEDFFQLYWDKISKKESHKCKMFNMITDIFEMITSYSFRVAEPSVTWQRYNFYVVRILKVYDLSKCQVSNGVLLMIATMLSIKASELNHLISENLYFWPTSPYFSHIQPPLATTNLPFVSVVLASLGYT